MRTLTGSTNPTNSIGQLTPQARPTERGSQTTEYALLLIVAATIAMVLLNWAKSDGGISSLMDTIIGEVLSLFGIG